MHTSVWFIAALLPGLASAAPAATPNPAPNSDRALQQAQVEIERHIAINEGLDETSLVAGDMGTGRTVKGAPYCADAVHESVQWLPDGSGGVGNRIVRQQTSRLCRDGEGRTRQEIERGGRKLVYLRDPLSGENWVLDPERKTARRIVTATLTANFESTDSGALRDFSERMREWARQMAERARGGAEPGAWPAPPKPPTPAEPGAAPAAPVSPAPVVISRSTDGGAQTEVRVIRLPAGSQPGGEWALPPPPVQWRAQNLAPRGTGSVTPLPARDIEGLRAHGERTTWVIAAGQVGNEKPIEITREVWTSPELMLTLSSRDFDPRSGEISYRLKGLKRGEPDAALMRVPADFSRPARPGAKSPAPKG